MTHCWNVASLSIFYRYYFGRFLSKPSQLVPLPYYGGRSTHCSDKLHNFSVTIPIYYKEIYVSHFFPDTTTLWNSLPIECFLLTYDLTPFSPRFFSNKFSVCFNLFLCYIKKKWVYVSMCAFLKSCAHH